MHLKVIFVNISIVNDGINLLDILYPFVCSMWGILVFDELTEEQ